MLWDGVVWNVALRCVALCCVVARRGVARGAFHSDDFVVVVAFSPASPATAGFSSSGSFVRSVSLSALRAPPAVEGGVQFAGGP